MNPYQVLEISPGAPAEEIKAAYHRMAKQWHPDRFSGEAKAQAEARFRELAEAFSMLKDVGREEVEEPAAKEPPPPPPPTIQLDAGNERPPQNKTVDEWFGEAKAALDERAYERALGLVQYAIRLNGERGEFHALYARILAATGGDKRTLVRALETAVRLNPRDVDSSILLAQTFQGLGMHARASRLWSAVRSMAPNHPLFAEPDKASKKTKAADQVTGLKDQFTALLAEGKDAFNRLFKRG